MRQRYALAAALALVSLFVASACTEAPTTSNTPAPAPTATSLTLVKGHGGIRGKIANASALWVGTIAYAYAAPFFPTEGNEGVYVLEPSIHPQAALDPDGTFQMNDVPAGAYVVVVGPSPDTGRAIMNQGKPAVFRVAADQITDLGSLSLAK